MIRQSHDGSGTEFSHWLRSQNWKLPSKDADDCFVFHNLDFVEVCWRGRNEGKWMVLEEKRHMAPMRHAANQTFIILDRACHVDKQFKGFHLIQFENTNPEDGLIYVDGIEMPKDDFFTFLRFESSQSTYKSYFKYSEKSSHDLIRSRIPGRRPGSKKPLALVSRYQKELGGVES